MNNEEARKMIQDNLDELGDFVREFEKKCEDLGFIVRPSVRINEHGKEIPAYNFEPFITPEEKEMIKSEAENFTIT